METKDVLHVTRRIGYEFKNEALLEQAFTTRSYSEENGGQNNQVLELIGDSFLNTACTMIIVKEGTNSDKEILESESNNLVCKYNEGEISKLRSGLVRKSTLANQIDVLNFAHILKMGKGDELQNIKEQDSVKEDLFEAIIGAVAVDCNYDIETIVDVVEVMLNPRLYLSEEHYITDVEDWFYKYSGGRKLFYVIEKNEPQWWDDIIYSPCVYTDTKGTYRCTIWMGDEYLSYNFFGVDTLYFRGLGKVSI